MRRASHQSLSLVIFYHSDGKKIKGNVTCLNKTKNVKFYPFCVPPPFRCWTWAFAKRFHSFLSCASSVQFKCKRSACFFHHVTPSGEWAVLWCFQSDISLFVTIFFTICWLHSYKRVLTIANSGFWLHLSWILLFPVLISISSFSYPLKCFVNCLSRHKSSAILSLLSSDLFNVRHWSVSWWCGRNPSLQAHR